MHAHSNVLRKRSDRYLFSSRELGQQFDSEGPSHGSAFSLGSSLLIGTPYFKKAHGSNNKLMGAIGNCKLMGANK